MTPGGPGPSLSAQHSAGDVQTDCPNPCLQEEVDGSHTGCDARPDLNEGRAKLRQPP